MPNVSSFGTQTDNSVVQGTVTDRAMVIPDIPPQGLMSVGPRVTPHFVKPSLWSALTTYHFFDAVHDAAGASYVAIKPEVPAGTELTDEGYWFLWADPNSQFADLSELVKTYNERVTKNANDIAAETSRAKQAESALDGKIKTASDTLDGKIKATSDTLDGKINSMKSHVLLIGNSYTVGFDSTSGQNSLRYNLTDLFDEVESYGESAAGFVKHYADSHDKSFSEMLTIWARDHADIAPKITHIIFNVAVGDSFAMVKLKNKYNDALLGQLNECKTKISTLFKNVKRTGVMYMDALHHTTRKFSDTDGAEYYVNLEDMCELYNLLKYYAMNQLNFEFYGWCGWNITNTAYMNNSDNIHPSAVAGYKAMVRQWKDCYLGISNWSTIRMNITVPVNDKFYKLLFYTPNPSMMIINADYEQANGLTISQNATTVIEKKDLPFINFKTRIRFNDLFKVQLSNADDALTITTFQPITNLSSAYESGYLHTVNAFGSPTT